MAENNAVTKENLQSALHELAGQLTKVIKETVRESAEATEAKLMAEMDRRFDGVNKRFRRAERKHQELQKEVKNQFVELDSKIMIRFDQAGEDAEKIARGYYRELVTTLDGYAGKAADLETEQTTLGSEQDKLRVLVEENRKSNGAAIADLKQRVNVLEEKVLSN